MPYQGCGRLDKISKIQLKVNFSSRQDSKPFTDKHDNIIYYPRL